MTTVHYLGTWRPRNHQDKLLLKSEWSSFLRLFVLLVLLELPSARSACPKGSVELWAYSNPSTRSFEDSYTKIISSDKGSTCRWQITASKSNQVVKLNFKNFKLQQEPDDKSSDCVEIYDGKSEEADLLEKACARAPEEHTSSDRYLFVVYHRGKKQGKRQFDIVIVAEDVMDKDQIIRIAIIIGGSVAGFVFIYMIFRTTRCCACLRKKDNQDEENANDNERDYLTGTSGNANSTTARSGVPQINLPGPEGVASSTNALQDADDAVSLPSDTPSLHELNEPPPSYDSLYLNEDGEAPPEYTPPRHKKSHPPRRVHTFN